MEHQDNIKKVPERSNDIESPIKTGFDGLDCVIGGLKPGELTVVVSMPNYLSQGFIIKLATNAGVSNKIPMAYISLEWSSLHIVNRLIVNFTGMSIEDLSKLSKDELDKLVMPLSESPLFIDDTASIPMAELETKIRRYAREHGIKLVIIDWILLINEDSGAQIESWQQARNSLISALKRLVKELNLHIIVRDQLPKCLNRTSGLSWCCTFMSFLGPNSVLFKEADNILILEEGDTKEVFAGLWNSDHDYITTITLD